MSSAQVILKEIDLSQRVGGGPGIYAAVLIPRAERGALEPQLATNENMFLNRYTIDNKIKIGFDNAYFSALTYLGGADKLWVRRVLGDGAKFSAAAVGQIGEEAATAPISAGFEALDAVEADDKEAFIITSADQGEWGDRVRIQVHNFRQVETVTFNLVDNGEGQMIPTGSLSATQTWSTGSVVRFSVVKQDGSTGALPTGIEADTAYWVTRDGSGDLWLSESEEKMANNEYIALADQGDGDIKMSLFRQIAKTPNTFELQVYLDNERDPRESFTCSLDESGVDGFNRNIFIENQVQGSDYIRAFVNPFYTGEPADVFEGQHLAGGDLGGPVMAGHMQAALKELENSDSYPVTILMDGGYTIPSYQKSLLALAEKRKDCFAMLSTPYSAESSSSYLNEIKDYRNLVLNANSSYGALYSPHCKIYDKFNNRSVYVSPEAYAALALSNTAMNSEVWYPAAGLNRGVIKVLDARRRFDKGEMDLLYDAGINPIRFAAGKGVLIWGQKTLSSVPSALDRINVRMMLITIEPAIRDALEGFLFELNDPSTRSIASMMVSSYMNNIKARRGVTDFKVVCDETNNSDADVDAGRMNLWLFVKPTRSVEYIPFTTAILPTGLDFGLAEQLLGA
ncbi:phage tail sheath C-terminal domain-containing protein [Pseudoalteromonas umbrosa]|uniref:phage tail sheath C-terminal domain-containing protein n=1 Tax=Pseudoalteromonas umbrosa TaxID=3048489 RepID=UPI0024C20E39|nr:phage tail sheath C-terminal domain-containing protein [Pseudoalteromonas sp. B95]MDK1290204.1 phage tail sheath subtilisin-like domain-containing protein [Pseudoalteromonas sp. B95]